MKEQILEKLVAYLQSTEDFMIAECPEVIQQSLKYHFLSSLIGFILCLFLMLASCYVFFHFYTNPTFDKYGTRELSCVMPMFLGGVFAFLSLVGIMSNADTLIKVCIAPKYFMINLFLK